MEFLHTMVRVTNLDASIDFYCNKLGMKEVKRVDVEAGQFTLIFLAAPGDLNNATKNMSPLLELTYNWPQKGKQTEKYTSGRNFGHLAFRVNDIYQICQKLQKSGIIINRPPRDGHMAFVRSPDNISIELLQKGKALEPQEPWFSMKNSGTW